MKYTRLFIISAAAVIAFFLAFQSVDMVRPGWENISNKKINGVSFVAPVQPVGIDAMEPIKKVNASWVTLMPFAFGRSDGPELQFDNPRQWWGERAEGIAKTIEYAHQLNLKVMVKPHTWLRGAGWPGEFALETEEQWKVWEKNYRGFVIRYAMLSDSLNVEMLSIGTEYRKAVVQRPNFWKSLIKEVRSIYEGKLTYAANWDNYQNVKFWDDLDYIGIDSYFPISEQQTPTVNHLEKQWKSLKQELAEYSRQQNKPILFTEFGYESVDFTADGHWKYERNERALNLQAQANAYQAVFETFWNEPWFAGGFLWKWYDRHPERGGPEHKRFTPQNKPAEETVRHWYGRDLE